MRPMREGEPLLDGGVFAVRPRNDGTTLCDVEDIPIPSGGHKGPARVSTTAFREGWDRIFGGPKTVGQA